MTLALVVGLSALGMFLVVISVAAHDIVGKAKQYEARARSPHPVRPHRPPASIVARLAPVRQTLTRACAPSPCAHLQAYVIALSNRFAQAHRSAQQQLATSRIAAKARCCAVFQWHRLTAPSRPAGNHPAAVAGADTPELLNRR